MRGRDRVVEERDVVAHAGVEELHVLGDEPHPPACSVDICLP
jgi:hypothetical protein